MPVPERPGRAEHSGRAGRPGGAERWGRAERPGQAGHPAPAERRVVVTVTAAGTIDATYRTQTLIPGAFVRAEAYQRETSGKGVNVSAALAAAGHTTRAVVVLGEDDLGFVERSPRAELLIPVLMPGATRVNTSITTRDGETTKVNAPAPALPEPTWNAVVEQALAAVDELATRWLVISGTIPPLLGEAEPAPIGALMQGAIERGALVALDTSGAALSRCATDPRGVTLIKPNTEELAELTGRSLRTLGDVAAAARQVIARGLPAVYASLGPDGVLVVTARHLVHARAAATQVVNTAGAGDASLAGFLVGLGAGPLDHLDSLQAAAAAAASWGAHAVAQASTILPGFEGMPLAAVTPDPDPDTPLTDPA